jgi:adenylosuccinate synthase
MTPASSCALRDSNSAPPPAGLVAPAGTTPPSPATPIYEEYPGWTEDITGVRSFDDLPQNARDYVTALEAMSGARISAIGVGPGREAIVVRHDLID